MPIPVLVGADEAQARNPITFRGLTINDPTADQQSLYDVEDTSESIAYQQDIEPLPDRDGIQVYEPFMVQRLIRIRGWVRGTSKADLWDKIGALNAAFDPVLCYNADTSDYNRGYLALDFNVPTANTDDYATGLIASRYYVQAIRLPVDMISKFEGHGARMDIMLRAADPRRYLQSTESENRTGNGVITVDNSLATYKSWPIITLEMVSAAPAGDATITRDGTSNTVTIDGTQLASATTYILDTQARTFKTGSTDKIAAISGDSGFPDVRTESDDFTFAGFPSDAIITVTWRRAFV